MKAKKLTKETIRELGVVEAKTPAIQVGDTVVVATRVKEGNKERIQNFQGDIIAIHNNGASSTFTVRKIGANSVGVERIFPFYSPLIESVEVVRKGKVRRAKLYYLRKRVGRSAKLKENIVKKDTQSIVVPVNTPAKEAVAE